MGVEMIRDNHGSDKFVLQNNELYNDAIIAQNLEGYEIIKILNNYAVEDEENNYDLKKNFVSKVVSKNNSKTYALKKICSDYIPNEEGWEKKLSRNFRIINQVQNATKYYTYFLENDDLYMVYEFVEWYMNLLKIKIYLDLLNPIRKMIKKLNLMSYIIFLCNVYMD